MTENPEYQPENISFIISDEAIDKLLDTDGVEGVGEGENKTVAIFVSRNDLELPDEIEGYTVEVFNSGKFSTG